MLKIDVQGATYHSATKIDIILPEIDSVTLTKFGHQMAPLALVANLAISYKLAHQVGQLALVN